MQGNARPRAVGRPVSAVRRRVGRAFQPDSAARRAAALAVGTDLREPPCPRVPPSGTRKVHHPAHARERSLAGPRPSERRPCPALRDHPPAPLPPLLRPARRERRRREEGEHVGSNVNGRYPPAVQAVPTSPDDRGRSSARYRPAPPFSRSPSPPNPLPLHPRHQVQGATRSRRHGLEQVGGGGGVSFHGFQSLEDPPADDRVGVLHIAHVPHQLASALVCDCRSWAHARPDTARGAQPRAVVAPAGTWVSTALGLCVAALQTSVWT